MARIRACELNQAQSKNGLEVQMIGAPALRSLTGCTRLKGDLVLSNESFYVSTTVPDHEPIRHVDQLWALHSLREVTGHVYMDLSYFGANLKNLSFLENLVKVSGASEAGAQCHPDCDLNGCWGPRPDQCVRCQHLRAGSHLCVRTCEAVRGFSKEPVIVNSSLLTWPQYARRLQEDAQFRESVQTGPGQPEASSVCVPCHPECNDTCSGPSADECIGGCKTAWYNGFCVSKCPRDTYLNRRRGICEPCNANCHPREASQQPICSGPESHAGPGGCTKCERFLIRQSIDTNNKTLKELEVDISHVTCIRGDCPVGTYLSTEVIHPFANTSLSVHLAQLAETRTHLVPVCRPCHPLCQQCSAYSVFRSNAHQLGCIESDTYTMMKQNSTTLTLESTTISTSLPVVNNQSVDGKGPLLVNFLDGNCLACHLECQSGCWNAGINHCYQCLHFRIQLSFLPPGITINQTDVMEFKRFWTASETGEDSKIQFICVPVCPPGLPFRLKHPSTREMICHTQSTFSSAERNQLLQEQTRPGADHIARVKTGPSSGLLWISGLIVLVTAFVLCCCCLRLRLRAWNKNQSQRGRGRSMGARLGWKLAAALRRKTAPGAFEQMIPWNGGESIECQSFDANPNRRVKSDTTCSTMSQYSHVYSTNMSGPNLGRLVMINSDDLILDEQCGPLGSGAFGAVYRGLWRVQSLNEESSGYTEIRSEIENTAPGTVTLVNRPQSIQSCGTQSTGLTGHTTDDDCAQPLMRVVHSSGSVTPGTARVGRFNERRMLPVAVKILNDTRGYSWHCGEIFWYFEETPRFLRDVDVKLLSWNNSP
ncbi:unnamed protein product [Echinostoma caproni]|uniref:Receptor protein-tyrosine kinase n=1 Tax=Echinostoma caproni TaxID=27848 RepID=A0A183A7Y7_9TREM|nr:unnamed protein product [Echinostoma caproni]